MWHTRLARRAGQVIAESGADQADVMRSEVEPTKAVARMIRNHLEGIVAWARSRLTNCFLEALNGLFQAAKVATSVR